MKMHGYMGKMLRINLTNGEIKTEPTNERNIRLFIGGKGLAAKILYDEVKPGTDPLGPENKLIFSVGPATGTSVPTSSRYNICFKSPLTGIYAETHSGGFIAPQIKRAGLDAIIIEGASPKPVYIFINDDEVEVRDASRIWGQDTHKTEDIIREELGGDKGIKIASIGPAGENLVRYACICNDYWRQAGRCGAGAVMGSKKLKAIAVRGTKKVKVAKEDELKEYLKEVLERIRKDHVTSEVFPKLGTPVVVNLANTLGFFPTRYWRKSVFEKYEQINPEAMKKILVRSKACYGCPIACGKYSEVKEGIYRGVSVEGPEYETIYAFGGLCEIGSIEAIAAINDICDRLGMDTITAGNVVAFAMEAYKLGKLDSAFPIKYGDPEVVIKLLKMAAKREGLGNLLAEGVKRVSEKLGLTDIAIHFKGMEPAGYDPRGLHGMALAYAVSPRGACHLRSCLYAAEMSGAIDRFAMTPEKVLFMKDWEDRFAVSDSMIVCRFTRSIMDWPMLTQIYNLITGNNLTVSDMKKTGERIVLLTRQFNAREGIQRKDEIPPRRFLEEAFTSGPSKGRVIDRRLYEKMLNVYYNSRGCDSEGRPRQAKLAEMELL